MSPYSSFSCSKEVFSLIRSFLSYVDSACWSFLIYHRVVVLPGTVGLLSLLVGDSELSRWLLIIGCSLSGFPCVQNQEIYSHIGICAMIWIPLDPIVGFLTSVSIFHHWLLFRGSLLHATCILYVRDTHIVTYSCTSCMSKFFRIIQPCWVPRVG